MYDLKWYIALIEKKCIESQDLYISFMHQHETSHRFFRSEREEVYWVPFIHVLTRVSVPTISSRNGQYKLNDDDHKKVQHCFESFKSQLS